MFFRLMWLGALCCAHKTSHLASLMRQLINWLAGHLKLVLEIYIFFGMHNLSRLGIVINRLTPFWHVCFFYLVQISNGFLNKIMCDFKDDILAISRLSIIETSDDSSKVNTEFCPQSYFGCISLTCAPNCVDHAVYSMLCVVLICLRTIFGMLLK